MEGIGSSNRSRKCRSVSIHQHFRGSDRLSRGRAGDIWVRASANSGRGYLCDRGQSSLDGPKLALADMVDFLSNAVVNGKN